MTLQRSLPDNMTALVDAPNDAISVRQVLF
ncbi:hypothetical protein QFZ88_004840 [Mesorhizobium sp. YL-MeA3-2017]|nr:hypothetical protein [Mesorhizobium sp. YL-MeA3-2017]